MKTSVDPKEGELEPREGGASDGDISYLCMKYNRPQQGDRMVCQDPDLYCKFRPACLIHYREKRNRRKSEPPAE